MRAVILLIAMATLLSSIFPLQDYQRLLPSEVFFYPRKTITNVQFTAIVIVINWILPAAVVAFFLWLQEVPRRVRSEAGMRILTVAVVALIGQWAIRIFSSLVPGGGGIYAANILFSYIALPLKILILVGTVKVLADLGTKIKPGRVNSI